MADQDRTPPPDGFYWFERPNRDAEVVQVESGEISVIDGDDEAFRLESWPEGRYRLSVIEGRLLGRIPEPGQFPAIEVLQAAIRETWRWAVAGTEDRRNDPPPREVPEHAIETIVSNVRAELDLWDAIDHADLLRRYVALVVAEEGYDYTERLHGGRSVDGITFTPEELAHLKALTAAANG